MVRFHKRAFAAAFLATTALATGGYAQDDPLSSVSALERCTLDFGVIALTKTIDNCDFNNINAQLSNLSGFSFSNGSFSDSKFDGASIKGATFNDFQFYDSFFQGADFSNTKFSTRTTMFSSDRVSAFLRSDLRGANFSNARFGSSFDWSSGMGDILIEQFVRSNLSGANFSGAYFASIGTFNTVTAIRANFDRTDFFVQGGIIDSDFSQSSFQGADLSSVVSRNSKFIDSNFTNADLRSSKFSGADFSGSIFVNANLSQINLSGANLSDADLSGANLSGAKLDGANLCNAIGPDGTMLFVGCE